MKLFLYTFSLLFALRYGNAQQSLPEINGICPFEQWDEWRLRTEDGAGLFIREAGKGDTVLVLHGGWGAEHGYMLEPFLRHADKYRFVFYDQRASLRSPCADSLISVENHIEDVERIRKALGIEKLLIAGHSMGGFLAMAYLNKYPERVKGIVLISSAPARSSVEQLTAGIQGPAMKRWEKREVIDSLAANGLKPEIDPAYTDKQRGMWHRITFAALNLHDVKNWRKVESSFFHQVRSSSIAASTGPQEWDFVPVMKKTGVPVTVIHGDDDYLPLPMQQEWTGDVPGVKLLIMENTGHLCWIDKPQEFSEFLLKSLKRCE